MVIFAKTAWKMLGGNIWLKIYISSMGHVQISLLPFFDSVNI